MTPAGKPAQFPWRLLLYAVVILYLIGDLYWLGGPLRKRIDARKAFTHQSLQRALEEGWVATVNGEPITRGQLDQATNVYLFRRGKIPADLSPSSLNISRRVALQQLIDDTLVRQYAEADDFPVDPDAVARQIAAFEAQFPDPGNYALRREALGLTEEEVHDLIASQVAQQAWLEKRVAEAAAVTDADIRAWFDANAATDSGAENPPLVHARHLFLSTVESDTPERESLILDLHRQLVEGTADFAALAAAYSEDERTKTRGGDLGWFSPRRMPVDFCDIAFGLRPGKVSEPFRTSLGWHIVEVLETRAPERLDLDALKPEIAAWLETDRRRYAIDVLLNRLKTVAVVEVFPDNFDGK
ncbi:MAG: peptidylprolyl isomerase [Verrucomicrobiae bacterium]|nr:peptidylprolyl isomerase [Verrucomicrobiae bacterium]